MSISDVFLLVGAYMTLVAVCGCGAWALGMVFRAFDDFANSDEIDFRP